LNKDYLEKQRSYIEEQRRKLNALLDENRQIKGDLGQNSLGKLSQDQ